MDRLRDTSSRTTIKALKSHFSRHGIPDILISDNGPQYASEEFRSFAQEWEFKHLTSSPYYPKSNGKAESAVKTCKSLLRKADLAKSDVYLILLDHRNTPTESTGLSPAQRLFGRKTKTLLPVSTKLLVPSTPANVKTKLQSSQDKQASYYNRVSKSLPELLPGDVVRMKLPGQTEWSKAVCKYQGAPRSYVVECNGHMCRRNHKDLRPTAELESEPEALTSDVYDPIDSPQVLTPDADTELAAEQSAGGQDSGLSKLKVTSRGRIIRPPKRLIEEGT